MKHGLAYVVALGAMLLVSAGCEERRSLVTLPGMPLVPTPAPSAAPALVPYVDSGFPAAPAGATVYGRTSPSTFPGGQRYVLYDRDRFGLQFIGGVGFFEYQGRYSRTGSAITFSFDALNRAGAWTATASIDGDFLTVTYNDIMMLTDFEDGAFVRVEEARSEEGAVSW